MKYQSFLLLSVLFLASCSGTQHETDGNEATAQKDSLETTVVAPSEEQPEEAEKTNELTLKARFIEFHLGDAEHYIFEDKTGKPWNFSGCESEKYVFADELDDKFANSSNQGWTSNTTLQGKWFLLTYIKREQPEYIDGPMATVDIITKAVLVEK